MKHTDKLLNCDQCPKSLPSMKGDQPRLVRGRGGGVLARGTALLPRIMTGWSCMVIVTPVQGGSQSYPT